MPNTYTNPVYDYVRSADQDAAQPAHHPVVIVGAGPSGLSAALDLALQGVPSVVLDDNNTVSIGSRAICFSKRTLEIMDRYGCGERMVDKGVTWQIGKVYFQDDLTFQFNLLPEAGYKNPAFINLQQYYFEEYLVDRVLEFPDIDLRWKSKVTHIDSPANGRVALTVETPDGEYPLTCDYILVADGANSPIRESFGLESKGQVFQDKFLIADIVMKSGNFPSERWFWFDPPFHRGQSVLLHKQPDNVWRIDFQLGWEADADEEVKPENVARRIKIMLGDDVEWEPEWLSVYTFRCRKMDDYIYKDRIIFIGDAAHQVSPFGARGANGGVQSIENLVWKLVRVMRGDAPPALLATYNDERQVGAAENILNSTRATDFITPKNKVSRVFRDETLRLAQHYPFARALINSGRLSVPCAYPDSPLNTPDADDWDSDLAPGVICKDAPVIAGGESRWLLDLLGNRFVLLVAGVANDSGMRAELEQLTGADADLSVIVVGDGAPLDRMGGRMGDGDAAIEDREGFLTERYDFEPGGAYLIRPDHYIAARWRNLDAARVQGAMSRALGKQLDVRQGGEEAA